VLPVLDDMWRAAEAEAFDVLGPRSRTLFATRDKGILDSLRGELVPGCAILAMESASKLNCAAPAPVNLIARKGPRLMSR